MGQNHFILIVLIVAAIFAIFTLRKRKGEGGGQWQTSRPRRNGGRQWQTSANGNLTMVVDSTRITIFAQDGGWKYVISDERGSDDEYGSYFSEKYETPEAAKYEALVDIDGGPSRHRTSAEKRSERRLDAWETAIRDREQLIAEISELLTREDLNITALRKPEKRIVSQLKALVWQIPMYQGEGVRAELIAQAEKQKIALGELARRVEARIAERKAKRKSPIQE